MTAAGARSWTFRYRNPALHPPWRRLQIGTYPDVSLSDARQEADTNRRLVAAGLDPVEAKAQQRKDSTEKTFAALAKRYMQEHARRHKRQRSADEDDRNLRLHVLPKWSKRDFRKIRRADVIELLEGIVAAGSPIAANRVQALISKVFSFAMDVDELEANPAARIKKRGAENVGRRVLSDDEIRVFWKRATVRPVTERVGRALRLALVTGARASEVTEIALSELIDRPDGAAWLLPAERSKNKTAHLVPLSAIARGIVADAKQTLDESDTFLFPSRTRHGQATSGHALTVAMTRLCASLTGKQGAEKSLREDPPSPHDLRRTFATRLAALGVNKEDRDACLNHTPADVGKRHYDLYEREKEKRAALDLLATSISEILASPPTTRRG